MADLTKGEIFREAQEKIKPITSEVEGRKKKLIENAPVIISFSVIAFSIILYAFNAGYCRVFNLPTDVMSLDMTRLLPLAVQILSITSFILLYISSLKADRALKKNRINLVRIIWGFCIVSYFFSVNNVPAVIGNWPNLFLACLIPLIIEIMIYCAKKPKKSRKVTEAEHQTVLEDTVQDSIFATYYIRYGIFLVVLPMIFAPNLGELRAKATREYQTCVVENTTYAVVVDYEDKVLVQQAVEQDSSLQIDTSNYSYFDKKDIVLRYSKYESVSIGVGNEIAQPSTQNDSWAKIKEVFSMPSITDWLMVIITFVYVIATIFICVANIKSAKATRDQLAESKRQYDEENRAYVTYAFIYEKRAFYGLRFTNHGKRVANKVKIVLRKEFIDSLSSTQFVNQLSKISNNECVLGIGQSIDIFFGGNDFRENTNKLPIEGDIIYSDGIGKYCEHFIIDFNSYPPIFTVDSEMEDIRQEMKKQTKEIENLCKEVRLLRESKKQENNNA